MIISNTAKTIIGAVLISISVFSIFVAISSRHQTNTAEDKFNKERAVLIKEGMDLQDKIDALTKELKEKAGAISFMEAEKRAIIEQVKVIEYEKKKNVQKYIRKMQALKEKNAELNKKIESIKKIPLSELLKETLADENNETIKRLVENTLSKIAEIRQGKAVSLEPIVITGEGVPDTAAQAGAALENSSIARKTGKILSVDKTNNLIVLDMGRNNNVKEGQRFVIMKDGKEAASAEIINTRYKISAAFISDVRYGHTINDIKEGGTVSIIEE